MNKESPIVRTMSMEEFEEDYHPRKVSPQYKAIRAINPGEAIVLRHGALSCSPRGCSLAQIVVTLTKRSADKQYRQRHINGRNGDVAVACVKKDSA